MRESIKIAGVSCMAALLLIAALWGWLIWQTRPQPPNSELPLIVRDLPQSGEVKKIDVEFKRKVKSHFRVGHNSEQMKRELLAQGFDIRNERAGFTQKSFPCQKEWNIFWHNDSSGKMSRVDATFQLACP